MGDVLYDKKLEPFTRENFHEFLQKEYAAENLNFWLHVERFRQKYIPDYFTTFQVPKIQAISDSEPSGILGYAKYINETFVKPGAEDEINIKSLKRDTITESVAKYSSDDDVDPHLFDEAQEEIAQLIDKDNFPRFKKANLTTNLNDSVANYRIAMFFVMFALNVVVVYLMVIFSVPQPYAILSFFPWFGTFDYLVSGYRKICFIKALYGVRMLELIPWYSWRLGGACNLQLLDEYTIKRFRREAKLQIAFTAFLALIAMTICTLLPNIMALFTPTVLDGTM